MNTSIIDLNTKLVAAYYNKGKPHMFKVRNNVTLFGSNNQLDQINRQLNQIDTRRVDDVEYQRPSTDSARRVQFIQMKLMNNNDVRTLFSIFGKYSTKGQIKLDASLVISFKDIQKSLI